MDTTLALTIIGTALSIVGALFFLFPVAVNEKVMDPLSESAAVSYTHLTLPTKRIV